MEQRVKSTERAKKQSLALYSADLANLEEIRKFHELDSLSQAVRKAIRKEAAWVAFESRQKSPVAA